MTRVVHLVRFCTLAAKWQVTWMETTYVRHVLFYVNSYQRANTAGLQLYGADVLKSYCVTMHGGSILESGHSEV